ncbi:hypothetical protein GCM10012276_15280 [Nocardioides deserti]|nr:hypothetical protein GCM10012276_15280 [Nocardioides deserti]
MPLAVAPTTATTGTAAGGSARPWPGIDVGGIWLVFQGTDAERPEGTMTAPIPEGRDEQPLDVDQQVPDEHGSELPDGHDPSAAEEAVREENAETSFPEPSQ